MTNLNSKLICCKSYFKTEVAGSLVLYFLIVNGCQRRLAMIVLLALSVVAVYIFGERLVVLRKAAKVDEFREQYQGIYIRRKVHPPYILCESQNTITARLIALGLHNIGRPLTDIKSAIENVGSIEVASERIARWPERRRSSYGGIQGTVVGW